MRQDLTHIVLRRLGRPGQDEVALVAGGRAGRSPDRAGPRADAGSRSDAGFQPLGAFRGKAGPSRTKKLAAKVDFRWFVPRIPVLARSDERLMRLALTQWELNRNQTTATLDANHKLWVANNCLKCGLWEVGLQERHAGAWRASFHGWFRFPRDLFRDVFEKLNEVTFVHAKKYLLHYPELTGFSIPLKALRDVVREPISRAELDFDPDEAVHRFAEQRKKVDLLLNTGIARYSDFYAEAQQPIRMAKFAEPGFYDVDHPMQFDLRWMGKPKTYAYRSVRHPKVPRNLIEIEVRFENGYRLLLADERIADLVARDAVPKNETELLKLTFGIGTPEIYADAAARRREVAHPPANYLLLLDAQGQHLDNHHIGLDRVYLWRERSQEGATRLHLHWVGFERIALVSHLRVAEPSRANSEDAASKDGSSSVRP